MLLQAACQRVFRRRPLAFAMGSIKRASPCPEDSALSAKRAKHTGLTQEDYRARLQEQGKYRDRKPGGSGLDGCLKDPPALPPQVTIHDTRAPPPKRAADGTFVFPDFPKFQPNLSPKEVLQRGSFGGTYYRDIVSAVTGIKHNGRETISEFPGDWFAGLDLDKFVLSKSYDKNLNRYKVSCGGSLGQWETSGWISNIDPYGWFQWYCRFFQGRRSTDDERQVGRWKKGQGPTGRWRLQLAKKCVDAKRPYDDAKISPVIRQTCQHWAYELTAADMKAFLER